MPQRAPVDFRARLASRSPHHPVALRAEFLNGQFWILNARRFSAWAADVASRDETTAGYDPVLFVAEAIELILDGERVCPDDERPVPFVLRIIEEVVTTPIRRYWW
jgi:hypothetical protein